MHFGHLYIFLALASYSSLGILHKVAEIRNCRALLISFLMCAWSLVFLVTTQLALGKGLYVPFAVTALAFPFGICAGVAILALQTALGLGNISTSWLAVNLSAGIPTALSILLYREPVNRWKILSLVAMAFSMVLLWKDSQSKQKPTVVSSVHE
jgi:EamA domain-containing membrane protein RarD